jgi:hypothetical protein
MSALLFLSLMVFNFLCIKSFNLAVDYTTFTDENFKSMIKQVDEFLSSDGFSRIPKMVRLSFHDCISGCNGCINATNPDNAGLTAIATESTSFHRNFINLKFYGNSLSRADFWAIMASRALYIASNNSPGLTQPVLDFKFGRKDCQAGSLLDQTEILPGAGGSWDKVRGAFDKFGLTNREIVALMGTHSLGGAKFDRTGYDGRFQVPGFTFDNSYFKNLVNSTMNYVNVPIGNKHQWNATIDWCNTTDPRCRVKAIKRMFFNSDMALFKNFTVGQNEKASCNYQTCGKNIYTSSYVEEYATNEPKFKQDFGPVFTKIIEHGYTGNCVLIDPMKPCA